MTGVPHMLRGTVVNCRLVSGIVHEAGVKLDQQIDPARFDTVGEAWERPGYTGLPELEGVAVHVGSSPLHRRWVSTMLDASGMQTMTFVDVDELLAGIDDVDPVVILTEDEAEHRKLVAALGSSVRIIALDWSGQSEPRGIPCPQPPAEFVEAVSLVLSDSGQECPGEARRAA